MALPLHEQLRNEQWRRMINAAGPGDLESLRTMANCILDYAIAHRGLAMQLMDPTAKASAAEATEATLLLP
jgi:hypothetical protein